MPNYAFYVWTLGNGRNSLHNNLKYMKNINRNIVEYIHDEKQKGIWLNEYKDSYNHNYLVMK